MRRPIGGRAAGRSVGWAGGRRSAASRPGVRTGECTLVSPGPTDRPTGGRAGWVKAKRSAPTEQAGGRAGGRQGGRVSVCAQLCRTLRPNKALPSVRSSVQLVASARRVQKSRGSTSNGPRRPSPGRPLSLSLSPRPARQPTVLYERPASTRRL